VKRRVKRREEGRESRKIARGERRGVIEIDQRIATGQNKR